MRGLRLPSSRLPPPRMNRRRNSRAPSASSSSRRKTPEGAGEAARHDLEAAGAAQAEVFLGDLRRGRLDARSHARHRARDPARGTHAAPHISCIASTRAEHPRDAGALPRPGHPPHRGAARRPALGHGQPAASSATPTSWSHSSATKPAISSTSRSPPTRSTTRRRRARSDDLQNFKRKVDAGANSAITQYFYNADAYFRFVDDCEAIGISDPDRARHHADRQLQRSSRASRTPAAPRSRAGCAASCEGYGDDPASIRAFGLDVVTELCDDLLAARRAGPALLHPEPGRADDDDLAAAGLVGRAEARPTQLPLLPAQSQSPQYGVSAAFRYPGSIRARRAAPGGRVPSQWRGRRSSPPPRPPTGVRRASHRRTNLPAHQGCRRCLSAAAPGVPARAAPRPPAQRAP